ncbi:MAG: histidinol-phosphate transaminase [Candidatus Omnitrophica bacterium]|nr:histidinol-phosphate transaminase [Candidatus Omnitrophota bacterium]
MSFVNPNIKGVKSYVAGKSIEELSRESGLDAKRIVKLASNENPLGSSPKAKAAIRRKLKDINRYPDMHYYFLRRKLASKFKLNINSVVVGNGSDELIDCVIKAFSRVGDEVISAKITFLEYEIISKINGRKFKAIKLKDYCYDLKAILAAITSKTRLIFIANPNNPTGTYVNAQEVKDFIKKVPKRIVVVFDEAYNEFIDVGDFPKTLKLIGNNNIIILRTFSKSYGLAGLRVGFALGKSSLINIMNKVRQPFNVNSLAQVAATAAIDDKAFLAKTRRLVLKEKRFLYSNFKQMQIDYIPSVANFILIDIGKGARRICRYLLEKGIILRSMAGYGLYDSIRVTIGTHAQNLRFINELKHMRMR